MGDLATYDWSVLEECVRGCVPNISQLPTTFNSKTHTYVSPEVSGAGQDICTHKP